MGSLPDRNCPILERLKKAGWDYSLRRLCAVWGYEAMNASQRSHNYTGVPFLGNAAPAEDTELLAKISPQITQRKLKPWKSGAGRLARPARRKSAFRGNSEWGRLMRSRQLLQQSPKKRQAIARAGEKVGGKARWRKPRVVEIKAVAPE
jgi:hypothetical protein